MIRLSKREKFFDESKGGTKFSKIFDSVSVSFKYSFVALTLEYGSMEADSFERICCFCCVMMQKKGFNNWRKISHRLVSHQIDPWSNTLVQLLCTLMASNSHFIVKNIFCFPTAK